MRKSYPGDISREQFEFVRAALEGARKKTCPGKVDLCDVLRAVLYLLRTGCSRRCLPGDFPKWSTVHAYWRIWSKASAPGSLLG